MLARELKENQMNRRWLLALLGVVAASKAKAQTLLRSSQIFVPILQTTAVKLLRPNGIERYAEIGAGLKTIEASQSRLLLEVDWSAAPTPPPAGFRITPKKLALSDGVYTNSEPVPAKHLVFVNGLCYFPGEDYTVSGNVITPVANSPMLELDSLVIIAY
jgi:hypothetical protein